jgi:2-polyprenyl-3-methyl-5-hydroxy-6-metoxy-1,4-benzoquinol methylase
MDFDADYATWKAWNSTGAFKYTRKDAKYFRGQFRRIEWNGSRVLEIGFGNGAFLAWASSQRARATGTELNPNMVKFGAERGFDVHCGRVDEIQELSIEKFDLVVLIDVLEHLPDSDLRRTLDWIVSHLSDAGVCIARFPNAASPFGLPIQYGDDTHCQTLSCQKLDQLAARHKFEVLSCTNQYRSWAGGLPGLRQLAQRALRYLAESFLRFILELREAPLDMNVVVTFRRNTKQSDVAPATPQ